MSYGDDYMNKIEEFQILLFQKKINCYIIPTSDFHQSEYVSDYFKGREYLSNFTGSAGTLVVTQNDARIWVDGRYFIQAEKQLPKNIHLMKMGTKGFPTIDEYLKSILNDGDTLAFDGRCLSASFVNNLITTINKSINIIDEIDLINDMWADRPMLPATPIFMLETFFSGESYQSKIERIREQMNLNKATNYLLTSLEDQAWLYNLRSNDVLYTPVFLAYTLITKNDTILYLDPKKLTPEIHNYLKENKVIVKPYFDIYESIKNVSGKTIMDLSKVNYTLYHSFVNKDDIINIQNPTLLMKAIKNDTEIANIKLAHIKDGVAVTKFMYYLKNNIGKQDLTEISVANYLQSLREEQKGLVELSFNTICAYKEHAAMMHYSANEITNAKLEPNGFLLVDSGGHYLEGTTDITRTFALGEISDTMKLHFTTVLQSVINLASAKFLKGIRGINLDILARGPIWNLGIDYKCGTGHGVGYLLSVHEGPNGFRYQIVPERNDSAVLEPGMITTDEPGIYLENQYGIRTENELLCVKDESTEFGDFLSFETITYAPIDLDAIDPTILTKAQRDWLNNYHKQVFEKVSPYLSADEVEWLKKYTREI